MCTFEPGGIRSECTIISVLQSSSRDLPKVNGSCAV